MDIKVKDTGLNSEEILDIVYLLPEYFVPDSYELIPTSFKTDNSLGAFENGVLVGFLIWRKPSENLVELEWIAVTPKKIRTGVGSKLLNYIFENNPNKKIFLFSGTNDSIIPNTKFDPEKMCNNFTFFSKNNFKIKKKHEKKWSDTNHAWEWVYNPDIHKKLKNNSKISEIGVVIRPILLGIIKNLNLQKAIVGICFNVDDFDPIFFAEKMSKPTKPEKMRVDHYTISRQNKFVSKIISSLDVSHYKFDLDDDEYDLVETPLKSEFGQSTKHVKVHLVGLHNSNCIFYIITQEDFDHSSELYYAIKSFKDIVGGMLHQTLNYISWKNYELTELTDELTKYLPINSNEYSDINIKLSQLLKHPLSRILSDISENNEPEIFDINGLANQEEKKLIKNIKGLSEVLINEKLSGSLQGKNIFQITATSSESTEIKYDSVIKFASLKSAIEDLDGLRKLTNLYNEIGNYLPPIPDYWSIITEATNSPSEVVITMPLLSGVSLHQFLIDIWYDEEIDSVSILKVLITEIKKFLSVIKIDPSSQLIDSVELYEIFESSYTANNPNAKKRLRKTTKMFQELKIDSKCYILHLNEEPILNPFYLFDDNNEATWIDARDKDDMIKYAHGDFHLGNILIDYDHTMHFFKRINVLDFDYVGKHAGYWDSATFEASMIVSICSHENFNNEEYWSKRIPALYSLLFSSPPPDTHRNNFFAMRLSSVLKGLENDHSLKSFQVNLFVAFLRLTTSFYRKASEDKSKCRGLLMTGIYFMGKILPNLIENHGEIKEQSINLFDTL